MRLVIFDCDGTLIDSQSIIHQAMHMTFEEFQLASPLREATLSIIGLTLQLAIAKLLNRPIDDEIEAMSARYKENYLKLQKLPEMQSPFYQGIEQVIDQLASEEETLLAIATGKSRRGLTSLIDANGWRNKFIAWRSADDCPSKPDAAMVLECCEIADCVACQSVMIGDASYDMQMAINAGAKALGVSWGYQSNADLVKAGAHKVIDYPSDIPRAIDDIFDNA